MEVILLGVLTAVLKGKYLSIEDLCNGIWKVFYRSVL